MERPAARRIEVGDPILPRQAPRHSRTGRLRFSATDVLRRTRQSGGKRQNCDPCARAL